MTIVIYIAIAVIAAAIAAGITLAVQRKMATSRAKTIVADAEREAEDLKRDKVLEGREEALKITSEAEKAASQKMSKLQSTEATSRRARTSVRATSSTAPARTSRLSRM